MAAVMRPELVAETLAAVERNNGSQSAAARELKISRATVQSRLQWADRNGKPVGFEFSKATEDAGEPPIEELIARMSKDFTRRAAKHQQREVMKIKAKSSEPMALCWFGDPHIDDNGCDWPTLQRHIEIVKTTPGMYACNLGDTTNNWVGNLGRLYASQDTSKKTGIRLTEWLFQVMPWFLVVAGNHDAWSGDDSPLQWLQNRVGQYSEWAARFQIAFPNGFTFDVDARHDHPGHSQDNPLHGQMKAKIRHPLAQDADLIIGGHKHTAALSCQEDVRRNRPTWYARARGYKMMDHYARNLGFPEQKHGQSIVSVINPQAKTTMSISQCFLDPEEAAGYLTFLRSRK